MQIDAEFAGKVGRRADDQIVVLALEDRPAVRRDPSAPRPSSQGSARRSAPAAAAWRTSRAIASAFACGSMPEHIWTAAIFTDIKVISLTCASIGSSLPARSSACRSSQPPTCAPSMKICGKVLRPLRALDHLLADFRSIGRVVLAIGDALCFEKFLGRGAVAAKLPRIDIDRSHACNFSVSAARSSVPSYMVPSCPCKGQNADLGGAARFSARVRGRYGGAGRIDVVDQKRHACRTAPALPASSPQRRPEHCPAVPRRRVRPAAWCGASAAARR